jgi:predicted glycoside hydrolase/deacetylase ChbG (UPF0249 family)
VLIVVNADDFGAAPDVTDEIIECFEEGLITSTSIMVGMPDSDRALAYAQDHPQYSYGVHLRLVGEGDERPCSEASLVPALVDSGGRLRSADVGRARALLGRTPDDQIEREVLAQIRIVQERGIDVSHVDSHRHVHKLAPFRRALAQTLPRVGVDRVRNVQNLFLRRPFEHPTYWLGSYWRRAIVDCFRTTDYFYMPTTAHDARWEELGGHLSRDGSLEVAVHPGRNDDWRRDELRGLRPFVDAVRENGHTLVSWEAI